MRNAILLLIDNIAMIMKQVNVAMNIEQVNEAMNIKQVNQSQTQRFIPRFEHPALRPRLHPEGFTKHYNFHKELQPHRSTQLLNHTPLVQR